MSLNPSWRPAESEITIFNERTWLAGMILTSVAYGIVFTLFVLIIMQLIRTTTKYNYTQKLPFIIYVSLMLILGTLYVGSIAKMTELGFIEYRLFPGGPAAFEEEEFSYPINRIANATFVIGNWMTNGMLLYRYMVIFRSTRRFPLWVVMLIPVLAYMASVSLSVVWLVQVSAPKSSIWSNLSGAINFTTPYCWVTLSVTILMTIAICSRLLIFRRRVASVLGPNHGTQYTSVASILVESAFIDSVFGLLFFIPFSLNNPVQNTFLRLLGEVQIIAVFLIIYRVAYGAAWVSQTSQTIFTSNGTQNSEVRVQVEVSGRYDKSLNHPSKSEGGGHRMERVTV